MSKITGKDIYSNEEWKTILLESKHEMNDEIISQLTQAIADYHSLNKKHKANISIRQKLLEAINILCEEFIRQRGKNFCNKPTPHQKKLQDTLDYWVSSLQKKSVSKSKYLDQLNDLLTHGKPHHIDREKMIEHLKDRNKENTAQRLKLFSGTYLEKIDPLHRQFEFNMNGLANKKMGINGAFIEWVNSNENTPFFLWLEDHDVTTVNRVNSKPEEINLIEYNLIDAHIVNIKENDTNHILVSKTKGSDDKEVNLSTRTLKNYSFKMGTAYGSVAFVWCKDNENQFLTHPHEAGKYHHSSLTAGKSVRCAGMWIVNNGIVTHISNSSGHYRPSSLSFYLLIKFLLDKKIINETTKIADLRKPSEPVNPNQPFGAQKSPYASLKEYLEWAEQQPDVKHHVALNVNASVDSQNYIGCVS